MHAMTLHQNDDMIRETSVTNGSSTADNSPAPEKMGCDGFLIRSPIIQRGF